MGIIAFFMNNKSLAAMIMAGVFIAGQLVYITVLRSEKDTLAAEKTTLVTELSASRNTVTQLRVDIDAQNLAISELKADAEKRLIQHAAEVKNAMIIAGNYKKRANELLGQLAPAGVANCDAANSMINKELTNARK